ncbi:uncharacterized protein K02A2.6 isoform X1 [Plutella xylostella]|uniref:uncharacterized protein K02A2.6 isoform X1 n=1 Tax=Plutella xylostella TaxID=51655 RepID=UPI002032AF1A|nr:uncharacterized protein K02A2.6 isoform X1 [Plutella xylostella]
MVYIDNIYIAGKTLEETNQRLRLVLERIAEVELKLKINKCKFFTQHLEVFGYHVSKEGIQVIKDNIEPLLKSPKPDSLKMLRSFLGKINYYNRFLKNMAVILKPLYDCLKNDHFSWNAECDIAFVKIKEQLANTTTLAHYSNDLPVILSCDASDCGVAAVLSVRSSDGIVKPVAFASKKLNDTQMKYPTIEKEALAIIFGVTKFYEYLFARTFELETDNSALVRIFGPKKGIPKMACKRLQHWAIFLSGFNYCIRHINSKNNPADYLSRYPVNDKSNYKHPLLDCSELSVINYMSLSNFESVNWKDIAKETSKCVLLSTIMRYCIDGWPDKSKLSKDLKPFFDRKNELTIDQGCLLWGFRVVIPEALQNLIMNELHSSHFGINRMKQIARSYFWWPTVDKDISNITSSCLMCLENRNAPEKAPLSTWPCSESVWERLHADFLGPIYGKMFLVIVDSYSKWPEVFLMSNITAGKTISIFKDVYTRFGYPLHLVVDNGPTWTSNEFKEFCNITGVKMSFTPPYHPATNGAAERFVQTFKNHVKKIVDSGHNLEYATNLFLFDYRTSVNRTTGVSPAKLLFGRELRSRFSLLRPQPISTRLQMHNEKLKQYYQGSRSVLFNVGEKVMIRDYRNKAKKWILGQVQECLTPGVTYMVEAQGRVVKRHVNQMLKCSVTI